MDGSGNWLGLVELLLVFALVFAWGLNELRQLRRYRREKDDDAERDRASARAPSARDERRD